MYREEMTASQHYIEYYGEQSFIEILIAKLVFHDARDLSDAEIERSFRFCALANKLTIACKELRNKIDWNEVIKGQRKYLKECDFVNETTRKPQQSGQLILEF